MVKDYSQRATSSTDRNDENYALVFLFYTSNNNNSKIIITTNNNSELS